MEPFELRGNDVVLAVPTVDDTDAIYEYCQDSEIQKWVTSIPVPYTRADAERFVTQVCAEGWKSDKQFSWAIREPANRRIVGMISLTDGGSGFASIGFLALPEARGKGIVSGAVRLVAEWAFDAEGLGLTHLQWYALAGNWASRRVAWATGFDVHATIPADHVTRDGRRDKWVATLKAGEPVRPKNPWFDIPELRGEKTILRPFRYDDADAVVEACNDPVSQYWLSALPSPYTKEHAVTFIASRSAEPAEGTAVHWAAALPDGGSARGAFSLMGLDRRSGAAEVGYWVHPDARGLGVATEAVALMLRHAFTDKDKGGLGLRRVLVAHVVGNDASRIPIERNGFKLVGIERAEHQFRDGAIADLQWYDLLLDEFKGS